MSTRGAIGWIIDGKLVAAYNHSDSYPSWLGEKIADEVATTILPELDKWRGAARTMLDVTQLGDKPAEEHQRRMEAGGLELANVSPGDDWYAWLKDTQGSLVATLSCGFVSENSKFLEDSLFCKYAYILDFDTEALVLLQGFNTCKEDQWERVAVEAPGAGSGTDYYAVTHVATLPLAHVSKETCAAVWANLGDAI